MAPCNICESTYHYERFCPHKGDAVASKQYVTETSEENNEVQEVNIVLLNKTSDSLYQVFVAEAKNAAVLDTACTKSVCGMHWLNGFLDSADESYRESIVHIPSSTVFKFGDSPTVTSNMKVMLPVLIAKRKCFIDVEVVDSNIPLLLKKSSLKKEATEVDLKTDVIRMFDQRVSSFQTSSGHMAVQIFPTKCEPSNDVLACSVDSIYRQNDAELQKTMLKYHRQFGHASFDSLLQLLKKASKEKLASRVKETLVKIVSSCDVCNAHKRLNCRPVVGLPLASNFNEIVGMDLHEIESNLWYLHIIDIFSRQSAAGIIMTKQADIVIEKSFVHWVSVYGVPQTIMNDNGGEFNNEKFREICLMNISVKTSASYCPWSNGIVERANAIVTDAMRKIKYDQNVSWETALCWAVYAKNCLNNVHGFISHQIVFGQNPNNPSVENNVTSRNGDIKSTTDYVRKHLNCLHEARKAFILSDSSERIKRSLSKNTRKNGQRFSNGESVYYWRKNNWLGPAKVIGQDSSLVFLRHGGARIRAHRTQIKSETKSCENDHEERKVRNHVCTQAGPGDIDTASDDDGEENHLDPNCDIEQSSQIEPSTLPAVRDSEKKLQFI